MLNLRLVNPEQSFSFASSGEVSGLTAGFLVQLNWKIEGWNISPNLILEPPFAVQKKLNKVAVNARTVLNMSAWCASHVAPLAAASPPLLRRGAGRSPDAGKLFM